MGDLFNFYSPICLNRPLAAKMTTCGHIFCWPCLLRHISFCKDDPKKKHAYCPICMTYLETDNLKSVELRRSTEVAPGTTIEMQLMVKAKGCSMGFPYDVWRQQQQKGATEGAKTAVPQLPRYNQDHARFSHFSLSSNPQNIFLREEDELLLLREQCNADGCLDLIPFVEGAIEIIRANTKTSPSPQTTKMNSEANIKSPSQTTKMNFEANIKTSSQTEKMSSEANSKITPSPQTTKIDPEQKPIEKTKEKRVNVCDILADESLSFYYQIATGENVFLSAFNMSMLEKEVSAHGSLLPQRITARAEAIESYIQSEEVRRTHKRLCFLPLTASFTVVEADPSFFRLSKDVYATFAPKIRAKRAKRESQKRRDKAEKEAFEATPMFPAAPVFSDADFLPLLPLPPQPQGPPTLDECPPLPSLSPDSNSQQEPVATTAQKSAVKSPWGSGSYDAIRKKEKEKEKDKEEEFPALGGSISASTPSLSSSSPWKINNNNNNNSNINRINNNNSRVSSSQSDSSLKMYLYEERRKKEDMERRRRNLIREDELDYDGDDAEDYIPPSFGTTLSDSLVLSLSSSTGDSTNKKRKKKRNKKK